MSWRGARIPMPSCRSIAILSQIATPTSFGAITRNWARTSSHGLCQPGFLFLELAVADHGSAGARADSARMELLARGIGGTALELPFPEIARFRRPRHLPTRTALVWPTRPPGRKYLRCRRR